MLENLPHQHVMSSSFGAQSAVLLHLVTQAYPKIPVILLDTGYLFKETYEFIDQLTERLSLNLKVFRAQQSPAWQEARYGQLWLQGTEGIARYNALNKVEPLRRALAELGARTWLSGIRRSQSESRRSAPILEVVEGRYKAHPIVDWSAREVGQYLAKHKLPYHPLWEQGYVSIGDRHTTRTLSEAGSEEATRFFGLVRECGIHSVEPAGEGI
jgi:phosphoadenosine phosphosulfate reductase